ncbi:MAG: hypothetical protein J0I98_06625 [Mesorhizobium sp.]|nr:hypothetical protein [Mesorhizobium sp.]MBN9242449.1 hypothetical protein [Mesorhizobium sp.]
MTPDPSILRAMARLRKALEKRMRQDDRAEELARRERAPHAGPLADFDIRALARRLRPMLEFDGRGYRAIAEEMGVTSPDLSRVMASQQLAYHKVRAICAWAGLDPDAFYLPPLHAPKPRKRPRPTARRKRVFHVTTTETVSS